MFILLFIEGVENISCGDKEDRNRDLLSRNYVDGWMEIYIFICQLQLLDMHPCSTTGHQIGSD